MGARSIAGVHDPTGSWSPERARAALRAGLEAVGPALSESLGALHVAWVPGPGGTALPPQEPDRLRLCLVDGTLDVPDEGLSAAWPDGLGELRGDACVVFWDGERGGVLRDLVGVRPLVWAQEGPRTVFASHATQLLHLLERTPGPDPDALAAWVAPTAPPVDRTLLAGVRRLPAAGLLELRPDAAPTVRRVWEPRFERPRPTSREEAARRTTAALTEAVARRSRGPERTAVMLSGGLDSGAVAALAARRVPEDRRVRLAFAAGFPGHPSGDETERIRAVAAALDLDLRLLEVHASGAVAGALAYVRRWRLPPVSPNVGFWPLLLDAAAQEGVEVLLDGEGGDETFAAPLLLLADRLAQGRLLAVRRLLRDAPSWREGGLDARSRRRALRTIVAPGVLPLRRPGTPPRWWAHQVDLVLTGVAAAQGADHLARRAAGSGLASRHPLRDLDLLEELLRLPPELHFGSSSRPLLREAVAGLLPDEVRLRRDKSPFDSVFHAALEADREPIARLLDPATAHLREHLGDLDTRVARVLGTAPPAAGAARAGWALELWRLVTAELFLRDLARDPGVDEVLADADDPRAVWVRTPR